MVNNVQEAEKHWLGRAFRGYGALAYKRDPGGDVMTFEPQGRYSKAAQRQLHKYGSGTYCKFRVSGLPSTSGVYVFCSGERVLYVGKAVNLQKRFSMGYGNISPKNCYVGGQQTNCRINQLVLATETSGTPISLWVHECDDADRFETQLIAHVQPCWNRQA